MSKMYEALKRAQEQGVSIDVPEPVTPEPAEESMGPYAAAMSHMPQAAEPAPVEDEMPEEEAAEAQTAPAYEPERVRPSMPVLRDGRDPRDSHGIRNLRIQAVGRAAVIPWSASDSPGGEQYRIIRTRIVQHPQNPRIIVMSSAGSGDGKTVSAMNIAGVLSLRDNANVLLIDADFRRAGISAALGLPAGPGLSEVLGKSCDLQEALIRVEQYPNLYVLTAGIGGGNPAELLDTDQWKELCATVREHFNYVIVDAPPIAAVADYELIQEGCDGVIFVVRPDHSDRTLVNKAYELIPEEKRLGVVLNCASKWFLWKTHESYYYSSQA